MDTYGLIAPGVAAAGGRVTGGVRPAWCGNRGQATGGGGFSTLRGQANEGRTGCLRTPIRRVIITLIARRMKMRKPVYSDLFRHQAQPGSAPPAA